MNYELRVLMIAISLCLSFFLTACTEAENYCRKDLPDAAAIPLGIAAFEKINSALKCADQAEKPVLIIFDAYSSSTRDKAFRVIFEEKEVYEYINNNFIVANLYVDSKERLPLGFTDKINKRTGKPITTVGEYNVDFQVEKFNANAQPYYVIVDHKLNKLAEPIGYTPINKKDDFLAFLKTGISNYLD